MNKTIVIGGRKREVFAMRDAFLNCTGSYFVYTKRVKIVRCGLFEYRVEATLEGKTKSDIFSFLNKVEASYKLLNGDLDALTEVV